MDLAFVKKLKIQSPQDTLRALVAQFEIAGADAPAYPYVTVTMGTFTYSGIPVKIETVRAEQYLALLGPQRGLSGQDALSYLPLNMISALTVDNFRHHLNALAHGMAPPISGEAPTKLALERLANDTGAKTGKKISFVNLEPGSEEGPRAYFAAVLKDLEMVLLALNSDRLGKEALAQIERVELKFSESQGLAATRAGSCLKITVGFSQNLKQLGDELRRNIEKII